MKKSCTKMRRILVQKGTMSTETGQTEMTSENWETRACDAPLFSDVEQERGTCRSCHNGWTHEHNYPVESNQSDIDKLLAWGVDEYKRRTKAIESGESTNIDWLEPSSRITATELLAQAEKMSLKVDPFDLKQELANRFGRKYT